MRSIKASTLATAHSGSIIQFFEIVKTGKKSRMDELVLARVLHVLGVVFPDWRRYGDDRTVPTLARMQSPPEAMEFLLRFRQRFARTSSCFYINRWAERFLYGV